jgi:cellulose synthase/poly-beta-1,6-N-acetylglucosamine synthase-like glycosyltransferase
MKTAAVITVTNGKRMEELEQCVKSVEQQTYPCTHYILCDDDWHQYQMIDDRFANAKVCFWNGKIGGDGYAGQRWLAGAPQMITEEVTFFCNDDDWFDPEHVALIMGKIEQGYDWAYSLRSIYDKEGNFLCDDNCEALGELHDSWNIPGHHFVDWCMWGMKTEHLRQLAIILNQPHAQVDRQFYDAAKHIIPNFTSTNKHTFNFRLGGDCGVQKDFFEMGNHSLLQRFNGKLPWIIT